MTYNFRHRHAGFRLALVATTGFAMPPMEMPPGDHQPPPLLGQGHEPTPPFLRGITLSEEQRDKIFEIMHAKAPELRVREKELQRTNDGLIKLLTSTEFDEARAKALADSSARTMAEIALMRARLDHQIYLLLNPEQRKQVGGSRPRLNQRCGEPQEK